MHGVGMAASSKQGARNHLIGMRCGGKCGDRYRCGGGLALVQQACDFKGNLCGIKLAGRSKCAIMSPCLNLNEFMNTASSSGSFICMILRLIGMIVRKRKHQANESQNNYGRRESTLSPWRDCQNPFLAALRANRTISRSHPSTTFPPLCTACITSLGSPERGPDILSPFIPAISLTEKAILKICSCFQVTRVFLGVE